MISDVERLKYLATNLYAGSISHTTYIRQAKFIWYFLYWNL